MVRKKAGSVKKASIFAPPGKVMMIERNRVSSTPLKTPISSIKSVLQFDSSTQKKSDHSLVVKSPKRKRVNQSLRSLREIKKFQGTTKLLIPKAPFSRVVREISQNILKRTDIRFTALSLMALQEATEMAIVHMLEVANLCCIHAKRVTLTPADIRLTRRAFGLANALN